MTVEKLISHTAEFIKSSPHNYVSPEIAMKPELAGMQMFDEPVFAFGDPRDPLFDTLDKADSNISIRPLDWLPDAKGIVSFFLPFTQRVKDSNALDMSYPSTEWLHARIEGQVALSVLSAELKSLLESGGHKAIVPPQDARFTSGNYTSNWSERHIAYICGLGTFGLSKGLITKKGMAGRFGSLITTFEPPYTPREYTGLYDYCTYCGACIKNCPANAISKENGKQHPPCSSFLDTVLNAHKPYYGCGKCQVKVPCSSRIPAKV